MGYTGVHYRFIRVNLSRCRSLFRCIRSEHHRETGGFDAGGGLELPKVPTYLENHVLMPR